MAAEGSTASEEAEKEISYTAEMVDKRGNTTRSVFYADGSVSVWQWPTGQEHLSEDALLTFNPAEAEEFSGSFVRGVFGALFLNPVY